MKHAMDAELEEREGACAQQTNLNACAFMIVIVSKANSVQRNYIIKLYAHGRGSCMQIPFQKQG